MRKIILKKNILFISSGVVLKRNIDGDYYPEINDEAFLNGPLKKLNVVVDGQFITSNPDCFEILEGEKSAYQLISEGLSLIDENTTPKKVVALLNQARCSLR